MFRESLPETTAFSIESARWLPPKYFFEHSLMFENRFSAIYAPLIFGRYRLAVSAFLVFGNIEFRAPVANAAGILGSNDALC